MWAIFVVLYKKDGEDPEQCLWENQSSQGKKKALPLQFTAAGRGVEKDVSSCRQTALGGSLCPASSERHSATTRLWLQMKSKSGCFKAALPEACVASRLSAAPTVQPCQWLVRSWLGVETTRLMSFTDTGHCGEVGCLPALSVLWLPNLSTEYPWSFPNISMKMVTKVYFCCGNTS